MIEPTRQRVRYSLFGLQLETDRPVPGLAVSRRRSHADLRLWLRSMPQGLHERLASSSRLWYVSALRDERGEPALRIRTLEAPAQFHFCFAGGHEFLVDGAAREMWVNWSETSTMAAAVQDLLGPVLGFVLRLRGVVPLHASVIAADGQAVALLGPERVGKSTTAAAFATRHYAVLSDDIAALCEVNGRYAVQPGFPWVRVRLEAVDSLSTMPGGLPPLVLTDDGRHFDLRLTGNGYRFQSRPLPLGAIYVLAERSTDSTAPFVESLSPADTLLTLVANTWAGRLLNKAMRAREFDLLGRLAGHVPLRRVVPHADPRRLPSLVDAIVDDLRRIAGSRRRASVLTGGPNAV